MNNDYKVPGEWIWENKRKTKGKKAKKHKGELIVKYSHRAIGLSKVGCKSPLFKPPYSQAFRETQTVINKLW